MAITQYAYLPDKTKLKVDVGEVAVRPPALGHVHRETPATPYTFRNGYTDGHASPTVVVDSGKGALVNERFHEPLTTTTTLSQTCTHTQSSPHFPISSPHPQKHRGWHEHTICGKSHTPPSHGKRLGRHNPPKFCIWLTI